MQFNFNNAQITEVLQQYEILTGKHVLADNKVTGTLNLVINDKVTKSEAIKLIEVSLSLNGYSLVPGEGDIVKVLGLGGQPRSTGVPIFLDPTLIPDSDQIVAFLARLRFLDPLETAGVLQQFVPPANNVAFNAIPKAGALLITDNAFHLKQLVALIDQIDQPPARVVEKFIRLERADATKAVEFLNSAFELKASTTPGAAGTTGSPVAGINNGVRRPIRRIGDDGQPVVENRRRTGFPIHGQQRFRHPGPHHDDRRRAHQPRPRRHQPEQHPAHRATACGIRRGHALRHPRAPTAAFRQREGRAAHPRAGAHRTGRGGVQRHESHRHHRLEQSTPEHRQHVRQQRVRQPQRQQFSSFEFTAGSNSSIGQEGLDTQPVDTTPTEATVGNTKIIADQRNNTIILLGGAAAKDKVYEVLDQLDVRTPQVVIRTVIGELSLTDGKEFGLNYLLRSNRGSILSQFNQQPDQHLSHPYSGTDRPATTTTSDTATSALNTFTTLATGLGSSFSGVGGIISIGKSFDIILSRAATRRAASRRSAAR